MKKYLKGLRVSKLVKCELYRDSMQNYKKYAVRPAQLIIADVPYNVGTDFMVQTLFGRTSYGFEIDRNFYQYAKDEMLKGMITNE